MKKIDDFFKKNVTVYQDADDQWNLPDDKIWEQAKVHLPAKKNKERGIIWFLLGIGLLTIFIALYNYNNTSIVDGVAGIPIMDSEDDILQESQNIPTESKVELSKSTTSEDYIPPSDQKHIEIQTNKVLSNHNTNTLSEAPAILVDTQKISNKQKGVKTEALLVRRQLANSSLELSQKSKGNNINNPSSSIGAIGTLTSITKSTSELTPVSKEIVPDVPLTETSKLTKSLQPLLTTIDINALYVSKPVSSLDDKLVVLREATRPQTELGVSRTNYFIGLIDGINLGDDPRDEVFFSSKIKNANFTIRRWLSPKWSLQTGLFASTINANLDFSVYFPASEEDLEILTNSEYQEVVDKGNSNSNPQLIIDLIDPPSIDVGDEIFFTGDVGLKLSAFQIPLFIHRHWYKKKMEYIVGGGFTLEYLWLDQSGADFRLRLNGNPVKGMISQAPIKIQYFDTSIYLEAGAKYHFSNHVNLGTTIRISVTEPVFSGIDIGLFYRW